MFCEVSACLAQLSHRREFWNAGAAKWSQRQRGKSCDVDAQFELDVLDITTCKCGAEVQPGPDALDLSKHKDSFTVKYWQGFSVDLLVGDDQGASAVGVHEVIAANCDGVL